MFHKLSELYKNNIDQLDAYVGGMLETTGNGPGELFSVVIKDQFQRLRDADRFWFENTNNGIFTPKEVEEIWKITLKTIIVETTAISSQSLQDNVFNHNANDPCPQPFQVNTTGLEQCIPFMRFDHFTGNEVTYIFTCILLGCVPIGKKKKNFC
jgi:dual oxidase